MSSFRKLIDGIRYGKGEFYKGRRDSQSETAFQFTASVQPLNGQDLQTLPEGQRESETYKLYTSYELKTVNEKNKTKPDRVTLFNKEFDVIKVNPWQNNVIPHYMVIVSAINA